MPSGRFITVEGIEGVGKSTNIEFICDRLRARGLNVLSTREPGGTELAEAIRDLVLAPREEPVPPTAELLLMFASRSVHLENLILPALKRGTWVVCDRFTDATLAYQGYGRGQALARIHRIADIVHPDFRPDLTLLLDVPLETSQERRLQRAQADRIEDEDDPFFARVRQGYLALAAAEPARFVVIDASRPLTDVQADIAPHLRRMIAKKLPDNNDKDD